MQRVGATGPRPCHLWVAKAQSLGALALLPHFLPPVWVNNDRVKCKTVSKPSDSQRWFVFSLERKYPCGEKCHLQIWRLPSYLPGESGKTLYSMPQRCDNKERSFHFSICSKKYPNSHHNVVCVKEGETETETEIETEREEREGREGKRQREIINAYSV